MTDWPAVSIWLLVGILGLALSAFEIAGMTVPGLHTISYYAHQNQVVKLAVFVAFVLGGLFGGIWWLAHSSHPVPR